MIKLKLTRGRGCTDIYLVDKWDNFQIISWINDDGHIGCGMDNTYRNNREDFYHA